MVCGSRMEAADVQVSFTQLFPSPTAVAATIVVGTWGRHLVAGGHIGLLQKETSRISLSVHEQTKEVLLKITTTL